MSRSFTTEMRRRLFAQTTTEGWLALIDIDHDGISPPLHFVRDQQQVTSNGTTYDPLFFDIALPPDQQEELPAVELVVDNVDLRLIDDIRSVSGDPITVTLQMVAISDPDTVLLGPLDFELDTIRYDVQKVRGQLSFTDIYEDQAPARLFTPNTHPSLF